jgi:hypothetical protein
VNAVIVGVDPGRTTGIVALHLGDLAAGEPPYSPNVIQCDHRSALSVIDMLTMPGTAGLVRVLAAEHFVVGGRSARSTGAGGTITRELLGELKAMPGWDRILVRPAGAVKPWATDERLAAAGLLEVAKEMRHAKDAARHALYTACCDYGQRDPLSRRAGARA